MAYNTLKQLARGLITPKSLKRKGEFRKEFQKYLDEWQQTAVMVVNYAKVQRQGSATTSPMVNGKTSPGPRLPR